MVCSTRDAQVKNCEKERYGKPIDEKGLRVSCNYCGKVVSGYNRLEHHLAGIRGNVCSCNLVPESVRASLRSSLASRKKDWMHRKLDKLKHAEVPLTRNPPLPSAEAQQPHLQPPTSNNHCFVRNTPNSMQPMEATQVEKKRMITTQVKANNNLDSVAAKSIGKFIFDAGLEPDVFHLASFKEMVDTLACRAGIALPTYESILQEQLRETEQRARELKQQWEKTGCSVILDNWKGLCGRSFIRVLVHCSKGMMFLRSMDASDIIEDVDELALLLSSVVDDVGAHNIVQIVTNDVSPYIQAAQHAVLKKYDHPFFFAVCADTCINLLLKKIAALDHVKEVLMKAREITRFIYGHKLPTDLKGRYIQEEILSSSSLEFVAVFITLERLVSERGYLVEMFSSSEWDLFGWASKSLFKNICGIVKKDDKFWCAAADVLKVTNPLVNVLYKLESDCCPMGILYDAMDSAKEDIKHSLGDNHGDYWHLVDKIWDNYLHTPLHAAGYVLNPRIFYTDRFSHDTETSSGITICVIQLASVHYNPRKVAAQLGIYQRKFRSFDSESEIQQIMEIPQVQWWSGHGTHVRDLQTFATRVLSQTCFGSARYNIDWRLSEQVPSSYEEEQMFRKLEFVHYNLRLANTSPCLRGVSRAQHGRQTIHLRDWMGAPRED